MRTQSRGSRKQKQEQTVATTATTDETTVQSADLGQINEELRARFMHAFDSAKRQQDAQVRKEDLAALEARKKPHHKSPFERHSFTSTQDEMRQTWGVEFKNPNEKMRS